LGLKPPPSGGCFQPRTGVQVGPGCQAVTTGSGWQSGPDGLT